MVYSIVRDVQNLMQYLVIVGMIRIALGLTAFLVFRWKRLEPDRPVKVSLSRCDTSTWFFNTVFQGT